MFCVEELKVVADVPTDVDKNGAGAGTEQRLGRIEVKPPGTKSAPACHTVVEHGADLWVVPAVVEDRATGALVRMLPDAVLGVPGLLVVVFLQETGGSGHGGENEFVPDMERRRVNSPNSHGMVQATHK